MICEDAAEGVAAQFAAIGQEVRLRILFHLAVGPRHVSGLAVLVGVPVTNVCQHLRLMRHAGLIECERQKFRMIYRVRPEILGPGGDGVLATLCLGPYRLELRTSGRGAATPPPVVEPRHRGDDAGRSRPQFTLRDRPLSFGPSPSI